MPQAVGGHLGDIIVLDAGYFALLFVASYTYSVRASWEFNGYLAECEASSELSYAPKPAKFVQSVNAAYSKG